MDVAAEGCFQEEDMRSLLVTMTAGAGLGLILLAASPASSITLGTPAAVRQAADALDLTEAVHCRKYRHRHRRGHGWSRGCRVGATIVAPRRSGVVIRERRSATPRSGVSAPSPIRGSRGNVLNPSNPQDRSGGSNRQDMTQPRAINPQDMR
jgi:hypothetical protein